MATYERLNKKKSTQPTVTPPHTRRCTPSARATGRKTGALARGCGKPDYAHRPGKKRFQFPPDIFHPRIPGNFDTFYRVIFLNRVSYGAPVVKKVEPNFARYFLATSACRCNGEMLRMWKKCFYS